MIYSAAGLAADHSFGLVLTAVAICLVAGWLVATLMRTVSEADRAHRYPWLAGTAVVAGLGVWTTHFVAMLGYRPDMVLGFDDTTTIVSALIAIVVVGLPLAVAGLSPSWRIRAVVGAAAGFGIGTMHHAGMAAIEGCRQTHSPRLNLLAAGIGACSLALACGLPRRWATPWAVCVLFTLAVTGTHFAAIAGTTLVRTQGYSGSPHLNIVLSIFTTAGAAVLFLGAFLTILAARRFDAQERAHSSVLRTALDNMSNGLLYLDAFGRGESYL